MKKEEYLDRLKTQLKGLPEEKQSELLEEISYHLDDTLTSPSLSNQTEIEKEMGKPEELGRRLRHIHRQRRWVDFLFVLLPAWLISPLSHLILSLLFNESLGNIRNNSMAVKLNHYLFILFCFSLVIIGLRRYALFDTPQLAVYWMVETWLGIVALNLSQQRLSMAGLATLDTVTTIETIFWFVLLVLLAYAFIRLMILSRDLSVVVLGIIPFTIATANLVTGQYITAGHFPGGINLPSWGIGFIGMHHFVLFVWAGLYFISKNRSIRWAALLIYAAYTALLHGFAVFDLPGLLALWSLPVLVVVTGYLIEQMLFLAPNKSLYIHRN